MPTPPEPEDVSLFWVEDSAILSAKGFDLPNAINCASFAEALEKVQASSDIERRPWIQVDGVLFGPTQIAVLSRRVGLRRDALSLDPAEANPLTG